MWFCQFEWLQKTRLFCLKPACKHPHPNPKPKQGQTHRRSDIVGLPSIGDEGWLLHVSAAPATHVSITRPRICRVATRTRPRCHGWGDGRLVRRPLMPETTKNIREEHCRMVTGLCTKQIPTFVSVFTNITNAYPTKIHKQCFISKRKSQKLVYNLLSWPDKKVDQTINREGHFIPGTCTR